MMSLRPAAEVIAATAVHTHTRMRKISPREKTLPRSQKQDAPPIRKSAGR